MANELGEFEGARIADTTIAIRRAGDGLSKALAIDPQILHQGDTVYVLLETEVASVEFVPVDGASEVSRKHVLRAGVGTIVAPSVAIEAIDAQRDRIQEARDAETGAEALDVSGVDKLPTTPPKARKTAAKATKRRAPRKRAPKSGLRAVE